MAKRCEDRFYLAEDIKQRLISPKQEVSKMPDGKSDQEKEKLVAQIKQGQEQTRKITANLMEAIQAKGVSGATAKPSASSNPSQNKGC